MIETDRLVLRPRRVEDAGLVHRLWVERDDPRTPAHRRLDADGHPTPAELADRIRAAADDPEPGLLAVVLRETGEAVGCCGTVRHGNAPGEEPELAYELLRSAQGRGYATEAAAAVVDRVAELGHPRLWAGVRDWNTVSRRVLARLGFEDTGEVTPDPVHGDNLLLVRTF